MSSLLRIALENTSTPKTLKGYERIETTDENIRKWKSKYRNLSHVKTGKDFEGILLVDDETFVAVLQCDIKSGFIVALEVSPDYQRQGIASALLKAARTEFSCNKLTVRESNKAAVALYEKEGYETFKKEGIMLYMQKI
jgi:ribosomal protein S18 acetylase RimI-like enzyme